jgi:tetratricopeptide (TPR) repeat protein
MADNPRIEELRRRVQQDPASIAFAALAEEYRRAGHFDEAITTCRAGLQRHPAYLSARVTLGRALLEIGEYDDARAELEQVLKVAPENLAANRALAEIHARRAEQVAPDGGQDAAVAPSSPVPTPALRSPSPISISAGAVPFDLPLAPPPTLAKDTDTDDPQLERLQQFLSAIQRVKAAYATPRS